MVGEAIIWLNGIEDPIMVIRSLIKIERVVELVRLGLLP